MTEDTLRHQLGTMATESVNAHTADIDRVSTLEQVRLMNAEDLRVADAVAACDDDIARIVDAVAARMAGGGRLIYVGAGTAGRMGVLDASEIPPTFGLDPSRVVGVIAGGRHAIESSVEDAEDRADIGAQDLDGLGVGPTDAVIGIAASGRTPYVIGALEHARTVGAFTGALSCNADTAISAAAEVGIEVIVGPEVITGSTRLKSGTAQKMVLNMISTLTMIKLGKTYGNLMVDVKASNEKLRRRSERLVMLATDTDADTARRTLDDVDQSVKTAILAILTDLDPATATELLASHDGFLRAAIAAAPIHQ